LIKLNNRIYLIETKAERDIQDINVKQKQLSTLEWVGKINDLNLKDEMVGDWSYIILSENQFYQLKDNGASTQEILELAKINVANIKGTLI
jgi:type III restriction enzyme